MPDKSIARRTYKSTSQVSEDYHAVMKQVMAKSQELNQIAQKSNELMPGSGDVIYGVAAQLAELVNQASSQKVVRSIHDGIPSSRIAKQYVKAASRKAPSSKERRSIRQRKKQ